MQRELGDIMKFNLIDQLVLLALLLVGVASAIPQTPYLVIGTQTINGVIAEGMKVNVKLDNNGNNIDVTSLDTGRWRVNLWDLNSEDLGSTFTVTYCISDTRCKEDSKTFTISGQDKWIEIDAPFISGNRNPFVVYGTINHDGSLQTSGNIKVEDITKKLSKEYSLDSEGFQFNLLDFNYDTGDKIRITFSSYTYEFNVAGDSLVLDLVFNSEPGSKPISDDSNDNKGTIPGEETPETPPVVVEIPETPEEEEPTVTPEEVIQEEPPEKRFNWWGMIGTLSLIILALVIGYLVYLKRKKGA